MSEKKKCDSNVQLPTERYFRDGVAFSAFPFDRKYAEYCELYFQEGEGNDELSLCSSCVAAFPNDVESMKQASKSNGESEIGTS